MAHAVRASILHFLSDPGESDAPGSWQHFDDGVLLIEDGRVLALDHAAALLPHLPPGTALTDARGMLLMPGFVDTHVHYVQTDVIAAAARGLLDWLSDHTFPAEQRFADPQHARAVAEFFLDELLANGTTTAMVYGSVHRASVDAFFAAAAAQRLRMVAGKALMDRNCPDFLRDSPELAWRDSAELIERWNGQGRLHYAITPRFAITSSLAQLDAIARLARQYPSVHIQTHVAENRDEIAWVAREFPEARSYLDVYDRHGLLRERAIYGHCIHLDAPDRARMAASGAAAAFCPTSNLFLGSGLFDLAAADQAGFTYALATDVGGGTSFSMLRTMSEAYKVAQLQGQRLSPLRAFYLAGLAGARALRLDDRIGNLLPGKESDFVLLDPRATPLLARRTAAARDVRDILFALMVLGDDRAIAETWVLGEPAHPAHPNIQRDAPA